MTDFVAGYATQYSSDRSDTPIRAVADITGISSRGMSLAETCVAAAEHEGLDIDETSKAYHAGQTTGRVASTGTAIMEVSSGVGSMALGVLAAPTLIGGGSILGGIGGGIGGGGAASVATAPAGAVAGAATGAAVVVVIEGVGVVLIWNGVATLANNWNNPVHYARGSSGGGPNWNRDMLSQSEVIAQGKKIREVDRLMADYGGNVRGWKKMKGWDEWGQEWHWYYHPDVGRVEAKLK